MLGVKLMFVIVKTHVLFLAFLFQAEGTLMLRIMCPDKVDQEVNLRQIPGPDSIRHPEGGHRGHSTG